MLLIQVGAVAQRCSIKKLFLNISQNLLESTCDRASFLKTFLKNCNFIKKETLARVVYCEFCAIFKNAFFYRTPPVVASAQASTY